MGKCISTPIQPDVEEEKRTTVSSVYFSQMSPLSPSRRSIGKKKKRVSCNERTRSFALQTSSPLAQDSPSSFEMEPEKPPKLTAELFKLLSKLPLCEKLPKKARMAIVARLKRRQTSANEIVTIEGEYTDKLSIVIRGHFVASMEGKLINNLGIGFSWGEESLVFPAILPFSVESLSHGVLYSIDRLTYQRLVVLSASATTEKHIDVLSKVPLLAPLSESQRRKLIAALECVKYRTGDVIVRKGDRGDTFFILNKGRVSVLDDEGNEIKRRDAGWAFGEGALQSSEGVRNATIKAVTNSVCLQLDRDSFQEILGPLQELLAFNFKRRLLGSVELFRALPEPQMERIVRRLDTMLFDDGEYICRQGDAGELFYIIKEGQVKVTMVDTDGVETEIDVLRSGSHFGEGSLLRNAPRRANVIAVGTVECFSMHRAAFQETLGPVLSRLDACFQQRVLSTTCADLSFTDLDILAVLGKGRVSTVFVARHKATKELFALKRMQKASFPASLPCPASTELSILNMLNNPFIVNLYGFSGTLLTAHRATTFKDRECIFWVSEYCSGGSVFDLMRDTVEQMEDDADDEAGCIAIDHCRFYAANCVLALEYIHGMGVIHRNITPDNMYLASDGYLKLAKFLYAKDVSNSSMAYTLCGTSQYIAPEMFRREGHSYGVDFWGLGVCLYEMASGFSLFMGEFEDGSDSFKVINAWEQSYPHVAFPPMFPRSLSQLLIKMLNPNPSLRYGSRLQAHDLKQHAFFRGIDWTALSQKSLPAPLKKSPPSFSDNSPIELEIAGELNESTVPWDGEF